MQVSNETIKHWFDQAVVEQGAGLGLRDDLLSFVMLFAVTRLGDWIDKARLRDSASPVLEFIRHARNAAAHANVWSFNNSEPRHPAAFRKHVLDASMNGQRAFMGAGTISPGDFLDLMDDAHDTLLARP